MDRRQFLKATGAFLGLVNVFSSSSVRAKAQTHEVHMLIGEVPGQPIPEFYFEPTGLFIKKGDIVRWIADTPHHTVTAYHRQHAKTHRVPEGVPPFSSPVVPVGEFWEYTFDIEGVYDYWCGPHELYGMVGRLVVGFPYWGPASQPPTDFGPFGTMGTAGKVLSDPALSPVKIFVYGRVSWDELSPASKAPPSCPGS